MDYLLPFIIKSSIALAVFYLYFHVFLERTKQFYLNRLYLLSSSLFAVVIPFLRLPSMQVKEDVGMMSIMLQEVSVVANYSVAKESVQATYLNYIYLGGVILVLALFITRLISLYGVVKKNNAVNRGVYKLVELSESFKAYSFFKYVFVSKESKCEEKIISHELVHVRQKHSIDIIIINILQGILWFNPIIYLYRKAIEYNHEYIADKEVIKHHSAGGYLQLLINQRMGTSVLLTNSFAQSNLKKRIKMMKKTNNKRYALIKYTSAFALPVVMLFAMAACNGTTNGQKDVKIASVVEKVKTADVAKDKNELIIKKIEEIPTLAENTEKEDLVYVRVEEMPSYNGGRKAMYKYLGSNMKYPEEAMKTGTTGKVYIGFVVEKDGSISNVKVLRPVDELLDAEAVKVVSAMPKWKPGKQEGKCVRVSYTVPVNFQLK